MEKITYSKLKLMVFFLYNMAYVFYMVGYIRREINLAILAIFIGMCIFEYVKKPVKEVHFAKERNLSVGIILSFIIISLVIQLFNNDIKMYLWSAILYNIIPILLSFFLINTVKKEECIKYFYIFFLRTASNFILGNLNNFTLNNILAINWNDSHSSVFESALAHEFLILEIIFLYLKKNKISFISMFFCMLSFKRISFILAASIYLGYWLLRKNEKIKSNIKIFLEKSPQKKYIYSCILIMILLPFILNWMVSNDGLSYFSSKGINLNKFTTGRVDLVRQVKNNMPYYNGYGSTDNYLKKHPNRMYSNLGSMHCDLLKLYYEVTELGVMIYIINTVKIFGKKNITFLMLMYLLLEVVSSHFIDQIGVWNMFFFFTAYVYSKDKEAVYKTNKVYS